MSTDASTEASGDATNSQPGEQPAWEPPLAGTDTEHVFATLERSGRPSAGRRTAWMPSSCGPGRSRPPR